eukprot:235895-Alexandrium_andersonii.AAC.1
MRHEPLGRVAAVTHDAAPADQTRVARQLIAAKACDRDPSGDSADDHFREDDAIGLQEGAS